MIYVLAAALFVFLCGAKFVKSGEFNSDYMSKDTTGAINGIFVLLVFMCHISGYMKLGGSSDTIWLDLKSWLGQLVVVTFLFYSGYGMMCSIMKKGTPYVKGIFRRRFLSLFAHFDIAVLLFLLMNLALGIMTKTRTTLLAFTTWESIGNSNWYITAVLCLYLILIVSFLIFRKHRLPGLIAMTVLTCGLAFALIKVGKPAWYYNTLILFPLGMWYAYLKKYIDKFVMKNNYIYMLCITVAVAAFAVGHKYRSAGLPVYWAWASAFMLIVVLVSMKIKIGNPALSMLGKHVFSVYILQRIPMTIFKRLGLVNNNLNYFILCFAATLLMAIVFDALMKKLDAKVFTPKAKA